MNLICLTCLIVHRLHLAKIVPSCAVLCNKKGRIMLPCAPFGFVCLRRINNIRLGASFRQHRPVRLPKLRQRWSGLPGRRSFAAP